MFFRESNSPDIEEEARKFQEQVDRQKQVNQHKLELKHITEKSQISDRNLSIYCATFKFKPEELTNEKILDVGSGKKETFSKEAAAYGAEVYSITPELRKWKVRNQARNNLLVFRDPRWQNKSIAARGENLPFQDESFDKVISLWSITAYLYDQDRSDAIMEMLRVLKPGGNLYLSPARYENGDNNEKILRGTLNSDIYNYIYSNGYITEIITSGLTLNLKITKPTDVKNTQETIK